MDGVDCFNSNLACQIVWQEASMKKWKYGAIGALSLSLLGGLYAATTSAQSGTVVGVSWSNFQEERWKTDEAAIKDALTKAGATYVSTDAQSSAEKQINDVNTLISRGAKAIILLAQDKDAIGPAINAAKAAKIPVIAYDRLVEDPYAYYLTFDNVEVGRVMAREVLKVRDNGEFVFIKGDPGDANAEFVYGGQREILEPNIKAGKIKVAAIQATEGWKPENAQKNMEQILTRLNNKVDVVMSSNDGMAGGAVAALTAVKLDGKVLVTGQDGDKPALNRVALGTQLVSVWKDSRALGKAAGEIAVQLAKGTAVDKVPGTKIFKDGPKKVAMNSTLLAPIGITRANLNLVLDAKWIAKDVLCKGVDASKVPVCK
jgi:D-xylose transport system substrate-binding protein